MSNEFQASRRAPTAIVAFSAAAMIAGQRRQAGFAGCRDKERRSEGGHCRAYQRGR